MKVALIGLEPVFGASLQTMLRARGFDVRLGTELLQPGRHLANIRALLRMDIVHYLQGQLAVRHQLPRAMLRRPAVVHWSGTDVLAVAKYGALGSALIRSFFRHSSAVHLADSPDLAREAAVWAGYEPQVVRLLPVSIKGQILPLPKTFTALSFWHRDREDFYGRSTVLRLAELFPQVQFVVIVDDVPPRDQWPANLTYLPFQASLEGLWPQISCLIRVVKHDSLSAMVLEALSRGRYVIYSKAFPHAAQAADAESARLALQDLLTRPGPNVAGAAYVNEHFDPEAEVDKVVAVYERLYRT